MKIVMEKLFVWLH